MLRVSATVFDVFGRIASTVSESIHFVDNSVERVERICKRFWNRFWKSFWKHFCEPDVVAVKRQQLGLQASSELIRLPFLKSPIHIRDTIPAFVA